jgi:hypothetical protein
VTSASGVVLAIAVAPFVEAILLTVRGAVIVVVREGEAEQVDRRAAVSAPPVGPTARPGCAYSESADSGMPSA